MADKSGKKRSREEEEAAAPPASVHKDKSAKTSKDSAAGGAGAEAAPAAPAAPAFVCAIASPLAGEKLTKKVHKVVTKGAFMLVVVLRRH